MSLSNKEKIDKLIELALKDAENKRLDAGYGGHMHDGGASQIEAEVKFYQYGLAGRIPPEWEKYEKQLDPEWVEYLRLKKKFGGK